VLQEEYERLDKETNKTTEKDKECQGLTTQMFGEESSYRPVMVEGELGLYPSAINVLF